MHKHNAETVNLATIPLDQALAIARAGGKGFLEEDDIVRQVRNDISTAWLNKHMPHACPDMSDDDFDVRMVALHKAFQQGMDQLVSALQHEEKSFHSVGAVADERK